MLFGNPVHGEDLVEERSSSTELSDNDNVRGIVSYSMCPDDIRMLSHTRENLFLPGKKTTDVLVALPGSSSISSVLLDQPGIDDLHSHRRTLVLSTEDDTEGTGPDAFDRNEAHLFTKTLLQLGEVGIVLAEWSDLSLRLLWR